MNKCFLLIKCIVLVLCGFIFISCSPSTSIKVNSDNSGIISYKSTLSISVEKMVRNLLGVQSGSFFNEKEIYSRFQKEGFSITSLKFPSDTGIDIVLNTPDINKAFPDVPEFISVKDKQITVRFNPKTAKSALNLMPPETLNYLDLLMAPLFTNELLSTDDYINLISVTYGNTLAQELKTSKASFNIIVPGKIVNAIISEKSNISWSNSTAVFEIPLANLLSLTGEIVCTVTWK